MRWAIVILAALLSSTSHAQFALPVPPVSLSWVHEPSNDGLILDGHGVLEIEIRNNEKRSATVELHVSQCRRTVPRNPLWSGEIPSGGTHRLRIDTQRDLAVIAPNRIDVVRFVLNSSPASTSMLELSAYRRRTGRVVFTQNREMQEILAPEQSDRISHEAWQDYFAGCVGDITARYAMATKPRRKPDFTVHTKDNPCTNCIDWEPPLEPIVRGFTQRLCSSYSPQVSARQVAESGEVCLTLSNGSSDRVYAAIYTNDEKAYLEPKSLEGKEPIWKRYFDVGEQVDVRVDLREALALQKRLGFHLANRSNNVVVVVRWGTTPEFIHHLNPFQFPMPGD